MSSVDSAAPTATGKTPNRWLILVGGVLVQLAIGAVYAWSVFSSAFAGRAAVTAAIAALLLLPLAALIVSVFRLGSG